MFVSYVFQVPCRYFLRIFGKYGKTDHECRKYRDVMEPGPHNSRRFPERGSCRRRDNQKKRVIQTGITLPVQVQLKGDTVQTSDVSGVKRLLPYLSTP